MIFYTFKEVYINSILDLQIKKIINNTKKQKLLKIHIRLFQ